MARREYHHHGASSNFSLILFYACCACPFVRSSAWILPLRSHNSIPIESASTSASQSDALDDDSIASLLQQTLPPLGSSNALLDGEQSQARRSSSSISKNLNPNARVRLFGFYGVADASTSFRTWFIPEWLELRIVELPGHGYLANDDTLPICAFPCNSTNHVLTTAQLEEQRAEWIRSMADQMEPLLVNDNQSTASVIDDNTVPYALYGFSFGALLAYELCFELQRRGSPAPMALIACGRGAPHAVIHTLELQNSLQVWDDEEVLEFVEEKIGLATQSIPARRRSRMAALLRCGMLFSGLYFGHYDRHGKNTASEDRGNSSLWDMDVGPTSIEQDIPHASKVPLVDCPVVSITGSMDVVWPPHLVERWSECTVANYQHVCLPGIHHEQLMNSPVARDVVFAELARIAMASATKSKQK